MKLRDQTSILTKKIGPLIGRLTVIVGVQPQVWHIGRTWCMHHTQIGMALFADFWPIGFLLNCRTSWLR